MVITFLVFLMLIELAIFVLLMIADYGRNNSPKFVLFLGWILGLFTAATGYVLFYQMDNYRF